MASYEATGSETRVSTYQVEQAARALAACIRQDYDRVDEILSYLPPDVCTRISLAATSLSNHASDRIWAPNGSKP